MASMEAWYSATEPGVVEVKAIPAAKRQVAASTIAGDDSMFGRLFRYISRHDVKMTVPVEAPIGRNEMRFHAGSRGSYSWSNIQAAEHKLNDWLTKNPRYLPAGETYSVFWNGPYVPGIGKRFEVHKSVKLRVMH